jgi:hypothetical protein
MAEARVDSPEDQNAESLGPVKLGQGNAMSHAIDR